MSAILAVFHRQGKPVEQPLVEAMLAATPERAVDGQSMWLQSAVALAHQHFWVTPEEQGERQPLVSADGHLVLSCDARLDNRPALAAALGLPDTEGRSMSDAALILAAYRRWGVHCVQHLLGDFGFALWDATQQHLFVACDALGARSLCYHLDDGRAVVASELLAILAHPEVEPRMNEAKVAEFLVGAEDEQEESFYEGIRYCPPGHCLLISADAERKWRYWDVDPQRRIRCRSDGEYAEQYLELLKEAVRCRLRCSGPVAISMSGGLDSTSLAALSAPMLAPRRLKTFSYAFDALKSCDEREYIRPVVEQYGLDATYIPCDDKWTLRDLPQWPSERDYLWSDAYAWLPRSVMAAAQATGCRLLLGGYFGDTLFEGGAFWALDMLRERRWGQLGRMLVRAPRSIDWRADLLQNGLRQLLPQQIAQAYRRLRPRRTESLHPGLHPHLAQRTRLDQRINADQAWRRFRAPGFGARYRSLTPNVFPQGRAAVRRVYNRYGLEPENPYYDRRLVEFVLAVPADQSGRPGWDRWVHRKAMRGILPEEVRLRRTKTNFDSLVEIGLRQRERETVRALLQQPQIVAREMIRADWLQEAQRDLAAGVGDWLPLWLSLSLELWLSRYW